MNFLYSSHVVQWLVITVVALFVGANWRERRR